MADEEIIGGYRLLKLMATGQSSQVYEVVEVSSQRHFAMKLLLPEKVEDQTAVRLLVHEATVGKKLAHPNIIKIVSFSKNPKNPYFVMEFFPAGSVKTRMLNKQKDFLKQQAHNIFKKVATGLAYMNASGWVHRDVKPDNFLVNSAGEVRLIDFALAKRIEKPSLFSRLMRRKSTVAGTRSYMSPEQIRDEPLDGRADIYSFGVACYEVVTGRVPFTGNSSNELLTKHLVEKPPSPRIANPDVTEEFADLILKMMAKKREQRPKDFHEVLMALQKLRIYKSEPVRKDAAEG